MLISVGVCVSIASYRSSHRIPSIWIDVESQNFKERNALDLKDGDIDEIIREGRNAFEITVTMPKTKEVETEITPEYFHRIFTTYKAFLYK
jgi:hypothetical protein